MQIQAGEVFTFKDGSQLRILEVKMRHNGETVHFEFIRHKHQPQRLVMLTPTFKIYFEQLLDKPVQQVQRIMR